LIRNNLYSLYLPWQLYQLMVKLSFVISIFGKLDY
jgi:hypothetical protein